MSQRSFRRPEICTGTGPEQICLAFNLRLRCASNFTLVNQRSSQLDLSAGKVASFPPEGLTGNQLSALQKVRKWHFWPYWPTKKRRCQKSSTGTLTHSLVENLYQMSKRFFPRPHLSLKIPDKILRSLVPFGMTDAYAFLWTNLDKNFIF